ncbi:hypothetical protein SLEP1_g29316 [Rubroshorea leprosula]|uniref:Uncharacterized protein n=1 Tax=Rubroshorea leprosula TaxID=152421 RepID=A0AAV5K6R3_9ROSI|nr:hypothetical protein SLEP1_g29316 [Rubroshorea leprosula]
MGSMDLVNLGSMVPPNPSCWVPFHQTQQQERRRKRKKEEERWGRRWIGKERVIL